MGEIMNCNNCGKQIDDESKFCVHCGAKIENQSESHQISNRKHVATNLADNKKTELPVKKKSKIPVIIAVAIALCLVVGGAVAFMVSKNSFPDVTNIGDESNEATDGYGNNCYNLNNRGFMVEYNGGYIVSIKISGKGNCLIRVSEDGSKECLLSGFDTIPCYLNVVGNDLYFGTIRLPAPNSVFSAGIYRLNIKSKKCDLIIPDERAFIVYNKRIYTIPIFGVYDLDGNKIYSSTELIPYDYHFIFPYFTNDSMYFIDSRFNNVRGYQLVKMDLNDESFAFTKIGDGWALDDKYSKYVTAIPYKDYFIILNDNSFSKMDLNGQAFDINFLTPVSGTFQYLTICNDNMIAFNRGKLLKYNLLDSSSETIDINAQERILLAYTCNNEVYATNLIDGGYSEVLYKVNYETGEMTEISFSDVE